MNKWKKRILIVIVSLALNVIGRFLAYSYELPAYLNLCGTVFASYYEGPVIGGITAILSCTFSSIYSPSDWYFLITDIAVAVAAGLVAGKNKYLSRFALTISATAFFTIVRAFILVLVNLSVYEGKSGMFIADAVVDYFNSMSVPVWLCYTLCAICISFIDCLVAIFVIYIVVTFIRTIGKRRRAKELKKQLHAVTLLAFIVAIIFTNIFGYSYSRAEENPYSETGVSSGDNNSYEESISFIEKLYNSENGLAGGCLNDIAMTADGSMWIGTYGGLFRFNGSGFILMDNLRTVRSVQCLYVDGDDRLWAGTQDAGVTLLNIDMSSVTLDMDSGLPSNSVKCVSRDSNGLYYFGTTGGLVCARYEDGSVSIIKVNTEAGNIRDLSPDNNGHMIVMNSLGEVKCYVNGEALSDLYFPDYSPKGISQDSDGNIYVGTDSGTILIYVYNSNKFRYKGQVKAEGLRGIRDVYVDDSGIMYVAGENGIGYFDSSSNFTVIQSGEFNNSIDHIFKDYQGNIWFTSSRCGLLCLGRSSFTDVFKLCNEENIVCNAVREWDGYLYVGTNSGIRILDLNEGISIKNEITDVFEGIRIRCIDTDREGNLVVATYGMGLMEICADGSVREYSDSGDTERNIRVVRSLSDGTIAVSSDVDLVFLKDHDIVSRLVLGTDMGNGIVLNILEADDHTLLCGTDGDGIDVIRDGRFERTITRSDGLPSDVVLRIVRDQRGDGYFITTGSGLCYMDSGYNIRELGMPYYNNFDIVMNGSGEVFILGGAGIYVCEYDSLVKNGVMDSYTLLDIKSGLPGSITSNAWNCITDDERIFICGTGGVYMLDLNSYEMSVDDFKTKITSVLLDGEFQDITEIGRIVIPKGINRVELNLEINNYTTADPFVNYYLSGVDQEKTTVLSSKLGSVTYYDIPFGDHDFIINVIDEKGRILSTQMYVISKERELYETTAFLLYVYIVLLTFFSFIVTSIVQGALWAQQKKEKNRHETVVNQLEREKAEALERALHMEEDANRTKSEFLANMSHEIRTPINAIIGMDTMIMRESSEANIRNYARDINVAGKTLLSLINDILDFSKIESGKLELVLGEYDLSSLINGIVHMIAPKAESKKLELEVNVNPDIPVGLYGDEVRIEQIIVNILNNAVKYTERGKVSFNVDYEAFDDGNILLKVSIKDTGIGIKPEDLEKLFSPYERIEEQRNKKIEGTGLGMSITKNLLEKMGSRLEVSSVYGEGSDFSFGIVQSIVRSDRIGDYKDRGDDTDSINADVEKYHAPEGQLLIVDDVEMNLIVATNLLKRIEIKVDTASSGAEAVEAAKKKQYDIILLDSMMPGMNGEETMHAIRKQCEMNSETPIIVLTAHAVKGAREEYLSLGYTNYLSKPIDGAKLEAMIQSYLPDEKIVFDFEKKEMHQVQADTPDNVPNPVLNSISQIEGIDAVKGAETAGGEDAYLLICKNFYETASMRIGMIRDAYDKEDYDAYTIQVHALKSSARLIGASGLSEEALELETAGREGNIDLIKKNTGAVVEKYEWYYSKLDEVFGDKASGEEDARPEIPEEDLKQCLSEMAELLEAFDMDTAKELFDSLADYKMPEGYKDMYNRMKGKMAELDRDGLLDEIQKGR